MAVSTRHVLAQREVLRALGKTAVLGIAARFQPPPPMPSLPGPELTALIPPRPRELVTAYIRHLGSDPAAYGDTVPAHLFPQWAFPLMSRTLVGIPYPLLKVVNAGCKLEMFKPLPQGEALKVRVRLESIQADEKRALMTQRVITETASAPEALVAHVYTYVPLGGRGGGAGKKSGMSRSLVPDGAREVTRWTLPADAGLDFAKLTGDFNPIHWVPAYARAMGFKRPILHGFGNMARSIESLYRELFRGNTLALSSVEMRFTKPLVLPAQVGLYVQDNRVYVGDAVGQPTYSEGTFVAR